MALAPYQRVAAERVANTDSPISIINITRKVNAVKRNVGNCPLPMVVYNVGMDDSGLPREGHDLRLVKRDDGAEIIQERRVERINGRLTILSTNTVVKQPIWYMSRIPRADDWDLD